MEGKIVRKSMQLRMSGAGGDTALICGMYAPGNQWYMCW